MAINGCIFNHMAPYSCMWLGTVEYVCFIWSHMVKSGLKCLHKVACHSLWLYMVTIVCIWLVAIGYSTPTLLTIYRSRFLIILAAVFVEMDLKKRTFF